MFIPNVALSCKTTKSSVRQRDFKSSRFEGSSEDVVFEGFSFSLSSAQKNLIKCTQLLKEFCLITARLQVHQFKHY